MRVVVCIKQIGHICHPVGLDRKGGVIEPEKMVYMLNPYDEVALEEAIRIKEKFPGTEVVALTLGPPRSEEVLRYASALGADTLIRIDGDAPDPRATAALLAKIIADLEYDLILCGKKAMDRNGSMVGSFIAEILDIGQTTGILKLDVFPEKQKARVERSIGKGDRELIECSLPALFTVERGMNEPRYPALPNRLRAQKQKIEQIAVSLHDPALGTESGLGGLPNFAPPRLKPKKVFTPDSRLSASERMRLIMSGGGKTAKKGDLIEGTPEKAAEAIMNVLVREKMV